ncbi:MAG: peptidyl-prolyl cis-trans isomerase [Polyangiaceae bacterium]
MNVGSRRGVWIARLAGLALLGCVFSAHAAPEDQVVARVGSTQIMASELSRRILATPRFQLRQFGSTPAEIKRAYLEKVLIPEVLFAEGAKAKKLADEPGVRVKILDTERSAMLHAVRKEQVEEGAISDAEAQRYYDQNRERFQTPERIQVWRILVATSEEAQKVIDEIKAPGGEKKWNDIARERSLDKTTNERGGALGFLQVDGQSNEGSVKADPALFAAAKKVKDGELVSEPVKEAKGFGVVWRRGTIPSVSRPFELEAPQIKQTLARQKSEGAVKALLEKLRKENVSEVNEGLLGLVEIASNAEVVPVQRKPGARPKAPGKPQPMASPQGSR